VEYLAVRQGTYPNASVTPRTDFVVVNVERAMQCIVSHGCAFDKTLRKDSTILAGVQIGLHGPCGEL
jgi:hypothetical protein